MYKRLIDEKWESYNKEGIDLDEQLLKVVSPILEDFIGKGFSSTDMELIAINTIQLKMIHLRAIRSAEPSSLPHICQNGWQ